MTNLKPIAYITGALLTCAALASSGCTTFDAQIRTPSGLVQGHVRERNYIWMSRQTAGFEILYEDGSIILSRDTVQEGAGQAALFEAAIQAGVKAATKGATGQ